MSALASPPGHAIEWIVHPRRLSPLRDFDDATFRPRRHLVRGAEPGMAATGLGPDEIVVKTGCSTASVRWISARSARAAAELKAATEKRARARASTSCSGRVA